jgi:hypothetical protein
MDARLKSAGMTEKGKSFPNVLIGNPEKQIEYLGANSEVVYFFDRLFMDAKVNCVECHKWAG